MAPLVWIALGLGGLYLISRKKEETPTAPTPTGGGIVPVIPGLTTTPIPQGTTTTIQVPPSVVQQAGGGEIAPEHTPSVTITVPTSGSDVISPSIAQTQAQTQTTLTPQQVATAVLPSVAQAISTLPSGATPQQIATAVIPTIAQTVAGNATQAAQTVANQVAVTPLHTEEIKIDQDPDGTIALAKSMINAEASPGWKTALQGEISLWQGKKKLTVDGKFGPKSALAMAEDVGVLPLIRYFPTASASREAAVKSYRDQINAMASSVEASNPMHAAALRSSAVYEQGQGWAQKPPAIPIANRIAQANLLANALKGA
jgi:hypothetical protein